MQGQNTGQLIGLGAQTLIQLLVYYLGNHKTDMTGADKRNHIVDQVLPQAVLEGAAIVGGNQSNPVTKQAIEDLVQTTHATMLANGEIQDTATLNAQPGTPTAAPVLPAPPQPQSSVEQPKYGQWLRLATPGVMPTNETLKANLFATGDALYNDGNAANTAEFYYVVRFSDAGVIPLNSPTGRAPSFVGHIG